MKEKERRVKQDTEEGDGRRRKKGKSSKIQKNVMDEGERKESQARYRRATEIKRDKGIIR